MYYCNPRFREASNDLSPDALSQRDFKSVEVSPNRDEVVLHFDNGPAVAVKRYSTPWRDASLTPIVADEHLRQRTDDLPSLLKALKDRGYTRIDSASFETKRRGLRLTLRNAKSGKIKPVTVAVADTNDGHLCRMTLSELAAE